jgi:hypothetical protein
MNFTEFITQSTPTIHFNRSVVCFTTSVDNIPILFISQLLTKIREQGHLLVTIDLGETTYGQVISQLEMSFLGIKQIFWLRGIGLIDKKFNQAILNYVASYSGPNILCMIASSPDVAILKNAQFISLDIQITPRILEALALFLDKKITATHKEFFKVLCQKYEKFSFDQACMIISYVHVVGRMSDALLMCDQIIDCEHSLFSLSEHFFAKSATRFFEMWYEFEQRYPSAFWCTFWSEQVWRAYYVYYFLNKNQPAAAKNIGFRLPFSFIQKDWKKTSLQELKNAHQYMYTIEIDFKNNSEAHIGLDLFFNKFFLNEFIN